MEFNEDERMYNLPNGSTTFSAKTLVIEWHKIGDPIEKEFGIRLVGFDPDLQFVTKRETTITLPVWFAQKLVALIERANPQSKKDKMKVTATIMTSHLNKNNHLYTPEALDQLASQSKGVPILLKPGGTRIGIVESAEHDGDSVRIIASIEFPQDFAEFLTELLSYHQVYCVPGFTVRSTEYEDRGILIIRAIEKVDSLFLTTGPADPYLEPVSVLREKGC